MKYWVVLPDGRGASRTSSHLYLYAIALMDWETKRWSVHRWTSSLDLAEKFAKTCTNTYIKRGSPRIAWEDPRILETFTQLHPAGGSR